jgi:pyrroline-5-carboxylate reductase
MTEIAVETPEVPAQLPKVRVAVLGAGKMGGILLQAFLKENLFALDNIHATVAHTERALALSTQWGVDVSTNNLAAAKQADLILIGVKPFQVPALIAEIKPALTADKLLVSFAAAVKTSDIEDAAGIKVAVVRAMPNTPSALGAGAAALCRGRFVSDAQMELAKRLFETVGCAVTVDEKHMDAVTGLSGSGPAYIYIVIEALIEGGVKVGLPRDVASRLAAQTVFGSAKMVMETGYHPALLKDSVTTPGGCTADGVLELEEGKVRVALVKAVMRATERARQLAAG